MPIRMRSEGCRAASGAWPRGHGRPGRASPACKPALKPWFVTALATETGGGGVGRALVQTETIDRCFPRSSGHQDEQEASDKTSGRRLITQRRPWGMSGARSRGQQGTTAVPSGHLRSGLDQRRRAEAAASVRACRIWHLRGQPLPLRTARQSTAGPIASNASRSMWHLGPKCS